MMVEISKLYKEPSSVNNLKLSHETALNLRVSNKVQRWNAKLPMEVTEFPIVALVMLLQLKNAYSPMVVTEFGISTPVSLLQPMKADSPMEMTEFGIVTLVNWVKQYAK